MLDSDVLYKSIKQNIIKGGAKTDENNIFINFCQISKGQSQSNLGEEDILDMSIINAKPVTPPNLVKDRNIIERPITCYADEDEQQYYPNTSLIRNQSQILQEEPINELKFHQDFSGKVTQTKLLQTNLINYRSQQDATPVFPLNFKVIDKDLENNQFLEEYLIIIDSEQPHHKKYRALFQGIAQATM